MKIENKVRRRPEADPAYPDRPVLRCAFTGRRPQHLPWGFDEASPLCEDLKKRLYAEIEMMVWQGYSHFISGAALGVDTWAAEAVLQLRREYPWIALELAIPCPSQSDPWSLPQRRRYHKLLKEADIITCLQPQYTSASMMIRNQYMVNNADLLLAVYDGGTGGTGNTVAYARSLGVEITCLRPAMVSEVG